MEQDGRKLAATDFLPERTESTLLPEGTAPTVVHLQVMRLVGQTGLAASQCPPVPVVYMKTVHAPVTVSAEEFARVIVGADAVKSEELAAASTGSSDAHNLHMRMQETPTKPAKHVKIKSKKRACC